MDLPIFLRNLNYLFILIFFLLPLSSSASIDTAISWLKAQQQADGSFYSSSTLGRALPSTYEATQALMLTNSLNANQKIAAFNYVQSRPHDFIEDMIFWIQISKENGGDIAALTQSLDQYSAYSEGYGEYIGHDDSVMASAMILNTYLKNNYSSIKSRNAMQYLLSSQATDGSWSEQQFTPSIYVSSYVSRVLQAYRFNQSVGNQIAKTTQYLLDHQEANGGWGTNLDTAVALLAIIPVVTDPTKYQAALNKLRGAQVVDGSWDGDVLTTALALQVLYAVNTAAVPVDPTTGILKGRLVNDGTGGALSGVQITIQGPTTTTATSNESGSFVLSNLLPGNYMVTYSLSGYQHATQSIPLNLGELIDVGSVRLIRQLSTTIISGLVTDAATHLPLAGALLEFTGSVNTQVLTDVNGKYSLVVVPGTLLINVSFAGHSSISANVNLTSDINFSPSLYSVSETPPATTSLRGVIVSAESGQPLPFAMVQINNNPLLITFSDANGVFTFGGVGAGDISAAITLSNYQSIIIKITSAQNSNIDVGILRLIPTIPLKTSIFGVVTDVDTGNTISGAIVSVGGLTATSAGDGKYTLGNIDAKSFNFQASATGYQTASALVTLTDFANVKVDIPLKKIVTAGVSIESFSTDQSSYEAYRDVSFSSTIKNTSNDVKVLSVQAQIINANGAMIQELNIADGRISLNSALTVDAGAHKSVPFSWSTLTSPPGKYRVVLSIYENGSAQLLDQREVQFEIVPTKHLNSVRLTAGLSYTNIDTTAPVDFQVAIRNQSNVAVPLDLSYQLIDPNQAIVYNGAASISVDPTKLFLTVPLNTVDYHFTQSGVYRLVIKINNGALVDLIEGGEINIAPNIKINMTQEISPNAVAPGNAERVHVKIRVEGTQIQ